MCGIGGFFLPQPAAPDAINHMLAALSARGPDARHLVGWDAAWQREQQAPQRALLHTRLSIRDPRPEADQPMTNPAGDIWICFNGEAYGIEADVRELRKRGYSFRTTSDTEFILHAYQEWGLDGLIPRLRGMFALVILDLRQGKLHLLRDRMGLKPIVYSHEPKTGALVFASLVRGVLPLLPPERRQLSPGGIDAYLAHRYVPAPGTVFRHIRRLENGHLLSYDLHSGILEKRRYWYPQASAEDWRVALDEAIRLRMVSDRPVGIFLSGGMDSSVIATRLCAIQPTRPHVFTASFPGTTWDESGEAEAMARQLGLPFTAVPIDMNLARDFSRLVHDLDEPFADPSAVPTWYLSRAAVREVTVVFGGDGGDEVFAGYKRYRKHLRGAWRGALRLPLPTLPDWSSKGWKKNLAELALNWDDAYALRFSGLTPNQRAWLQPDQPPRPHYWRMPENPPHSPLQRLLAVDFENYLPEYILRKADLCTMSHGLEMRAPLLDHRFYESILGLPEAERFTRPAKALLALHAPETQPILERKKRGFNPPLGQWLEHDLRERFAGLGLRLNDLTGNQIATAPCDALMAHYLNGADFLAEQVLQLLILDESLAQLSQAGN